MTRAITSVLSAYTAFLGAFLLFQVQPLLAKWILPWFGGSAGVWTTCMLVFQVLLCLGYAYAHQLIHHVRPQRQAWLHLGILALSLLALPIAPDVHWKPTGVEDPTMRIVGLLVTSIGLPFFLLSSTGPLLQAWMARDPRAGSPYRLYSLSNAGSMLALVSYPVVVEPHLAAPEQARIWCAAYAVFMALFAACALRSRSGDPDPSQRAQPQPNVREGWGIFISYLRVEARNPSLVDQEGRPVTETPDGRSKLLWLGLAACASTLLLAVTNQLCQDVAAIPFLWLLPLSLYLLTFILCFRNEHWYSRKWALRAVVFAVGGISYCVLRGHDVPLPWAILLYSAGLFVCCMLCHGELVRRKPAPEHLTSFYLMISTGGALGGVFVGLLAPRLFDDYLELQIGILGCVSLALISGARDAAAALSPAGARRLRRLLLATILTMGIGLWMQAQAAGADARARMRSFFGALKVKDLTDSGGRGPMRLLVHGVTSHGMQFLEPGRRRLATSYYGPGSGAGLALLHHKPGEPRRIGLVGLGAGTLAAYGKRGDLFRFYEINPQVIDLAKSEFTFLADSAATIEIVVGDARLELEREEPQRFDVLAVDAFSSDSIPVHLLTREAFELYLRHLKPDGMLALHVTNQYLDLRPVVEAAARAVGKKTLLVRNEADDETGAFAAQWILVASDPALFGSLSPLDARTRLEPVGERLVPWTDGYSNLFRILK